MDVCVCVCVCVCVNRWPVASRTRHELLPAFRITYAYNMIPGVFAGVPCGDERGGGERGDGRHDGAERVQRRPGGLLLMNIP